VAIAIDEEELDERGFAIVPALVDAADCAALAELYDKDEPFRSRIAMERHGYGQGEYKYFRYPLPERVQALRESLYAALAPTANRWRERLREAADLPPALAGYLERCHAAGQARPTPLLLRYEAGGYNRLHRDLYGPLVFPLQATVLLSEPGRDFEGGEFLLVEQRARMQSRAQVVPLARGDAVVFAVSHRPGRGVRGFHKVALRHGVSVVRSGRRHALGIILHDAK
jgi:hypothetical protein